MIELWNEISQIQNWDQFVLWFETLSTLGQVSLAAMALALVYACLVLIFGVVLH